MSVDEETFFVTALMMYGKPEPRAKHYTMIISPNFVVRGVGTYLREDPRGKIFTQCVIGFGEAEHRAGKWYYRYTQWWRKQYANNET